MAQEFTVSLQAIIDECKLEVIHTPQDPAKIFICTALLSQRNTPANPSSKGTTALLKMLLEEGIW